MTYAFLLLLLINNILYVPVAGSRVQNVSYASENTSTKRKADDSAIISTTTNENTQNNSNNNNLGDDVNAGERFFCFALIF